MYKRAEGSLGFLSKVLKETARGRTTGPGYSPMKKVLTDRVTPAEFKKIKDRRLRSLIADRLKLNPYNHPEFYS